MTTKGRTAAKPRTSTQAASNGHSTNEDGAPSVIRLVTSGERQAEKIDLFEIDGRMYQIAAHPLVNQGLRYLHVCRTQGHASGIDYMLGVLLGDEAYQALMGFDDLTQDDLGRIITIATQIMLGPVEAPKGTQQTG